MDPKFLLLRISAASHEPIAPLTGARGGVIQAV